MDAAIKSAKNNEDKEKFTQEHTTHLNYHEEVRNKMNDDIQRVRRDETLEVLTFDMEKTLRLPRIPTNVIFYKRQICLYNTGIHSCKYNKAFCYIWVEGSAGRGAQEVGSCLLKHIELHVPETVKILILWSDSCSGQNRNIKIILLLKAALENHQSFLTFSYNRSLKTIFTGFLFSIMFFK
ncbi:unnamed protein product [Psylliodes chrysocephalus]|uniref:Uncharacterized protein n=1 Tax=Psylliodes chrysocephalus TaxID=3402493 RepID=A0A9P0CXW1_9CUCU|nr:unnamed protein product [Psylliodes chrysocephala]